jgi:DNA-directed RNA polymerase subunit RPC12/RpoP
VKTYPCPACHAEVEAKADYLARGMKCPACGTGFIPEIIKTREISPIEKPVVSLTFLISLPIVLIALFINAYIGIGLAIVALLAGIFVRMSKK